MTLHITLVILFCLFVCLFSQESLLLYQMGNLEGCKQLSEDVCNQAVKFNSPNYNVIAGKAKSVLSGAYKQEREFTKAEEVLESSTEVGKYSETCIKRTPY